MKRFLLHIILPLVVVTAMFIIGGEMLLRRLPGDIKYKAEWMDKNCGRVKILVLGTSSVSMGIKPSAFSMQPSFNCAMGGQEYTDDYAIFTRYIDRMDSLRCLIVDFQPFGYCCGGGRTTNIHSLNTNPTRTKYYSIYYGCPYEGIENKFLIASGVSDVLRALLVNTANGSPNAFLSIDDDGYQSHYFVEMAEDKKLWHDEGLHRARRSYLRKPLHRDEEGLKLLETMIERCKEKGVTVLLVTCPTHPYYYTKLDPDVTEFSSAIAEGLSQKYDNVKYLNFLKSDAFSHKDMFNPNHLKKEGALKFTKMVNDSIMKWNH